MNRSNYLASSAAACIAVCAAFVATSAMAQTAAAPAASSKTDDSIVIVGSRLRRTNFNSGAPITIISTNDKLDEGQTTATAVLQSNAITGGNAQVNNAYSGYIVDGGPGTNTLGLRGLGATRTLILLNGRRLAPSGVQGGVSAVDLNTLPPQIIIDRYEVLRDGASSIYGSDAVAGVVNVVTRKKMGVELFAANSMTGAGAGSQQTFEVGAGYNSSRFNTNCWPPMCHGPPARPMALQALLKRSIRAPASPSAIRSRGLAIMASPSTRWAPPAALAWARRALWARLSTVGAPMPA